MTGVRNNPRLKDKDDKFYKSKDEVVEKPFEHVPEF